MIGRRSKQRNLYDVGYIEPIALDPKSYHGQLAPVASQLFSDDDFATLYKSRGRPSTPPSQLALLTLLQHEAGVSDEEAVNRSCYDARWAAVLGTILGRPLCAKSTLQVFRGQVVLHNQARLVLKKSLQEAKRRGLVKAGPLQVSVDTMPMDGAGAVKDTYNLLGTGIWQVIQAVAKAAGSESRTWATAQDLAAYVPDPHGSLKGDLDIDWSDRSAREAALTVIVADALRAYQLAEAAAGGLAPEAAAQIRDAQLLLGDLLLQDIEVKAPPAGGPPSAKIKEGTAPDRIPSASDPEQRHGHKSSEKQFTGQKSRTVVDLETKLIVEIDVLPGNAGDAIHLVDQLEQVETTTGETVTVVFGDCALGNGQTRAECQERGTELVAKVPATSGNKGLYPKTDFTLDLQVLSATCPAGRTTTEYRETSGGGGIFRFGELCATCPQRAACTTSAGGRTLQVHPQEELLQAARTAQGTPEGRQRLRERIVVEHRQARLAQLGAKQARYRGHAKSRFQLLIAATIANLRYTWNWARKLAAAGGRGECALGAAGMG